MQLAVRLLAFCLVATASPLLAQQPLAPLPEGVAPSGQARIAGLYAESEEFTRIDVTETLETLEATCKARGTPAKVEGRDLLGKGKRQIFRTQKLLAVFEYAPRIETDEKGCTGRVSLVRSVRSGPWDKSRAADWIDRQPKCERPYSCRSQVIAGVQAMCGRASGDSFVGTSVCYSLQKDLSQDLVVARSIYSDDGSGPNASWSLAKVVVDALIDPAVFEASR